MLHRIGNSLQALCGKVRKDLKLIENNLSTSWVKKDIRITELKGTKWNIQSRRLQASWEICYKPHCDLVAVQKSGLQPTGSSKSARSLPNKPGPLPLTVVACRALAHLQWAEEAQDSSVCGTEKPTSGGPFFYKVLDKIASYSPFLTPQHWGCSLGFRERTTDFSSDANLHTEGELELVMLGYRQTQGTQLTFTPVFLEDTLPKWQKPKQNWKKLSSSGFYASTKMCPWL